MSNRLTNKARENLIELLINRTFAERRTELCNQNAKLYEQLIKAAWGDYYVHIEAVPAGMIYASSCFQVWLREGCSHFAVFTGHYPLPIPATLTYRWDDGDLNALPKPLVNEVRAHAEKQDALHADIETAKGKLKAAVYGVNTLKQLYAQWPELATVPGIDTAEELTTGKQLAVSREELNAIFGLPVEA